MADPAARRSRVLRGALSDTGHAEGSVSAWGLEPGAIFAERYRIVRCLAQGGMGAVYEVVHLETERRRALKVMLPHLLASAELRQRFQREARIAANVESDFIVDVFDAGYDDATQMPFLVMELLRGEEVNARLKRLGRLPCLEVVAILHQTCLALDKAHRASIIHRDLKPENLFLTEREDGPPRVKVLDFGIAKVLAEGATTGGLTQTVGTPLYMAPEQFNPRAALTSAADLYALAMVAYKLLVGRAYWAEEAKGGNVFALAAVAIHGPKEPASQRAAPHGVELTPAFDAWFARATAVDPARRFATGAEMVAALAQALDVMPPPRPTAASLLESASATPSASYFAGVPTPWPASRVLADQPSAGATPPASVTSPPAPVGAHHTIDLPALTCPAPDATMAAAPLQASRLAALEAVAAHSSPSAPSVPSMPSAPSMPTGIAAPATAGTMPPTAPKGPRRGAVIAVAVGALGVLFGGAWTAYRADSAPPSVATSAEGTASPSAAGPATRLDAAPSGSTTPAMQAPAATTTATATATATATVTVTVTVTATVKTERPPPPPTLPPKKKKYTRE